ncbi:hypothetical protein V2J09_012784 [Rumex salicifolius]
MVITSSPGTPAGGGGRRRRRRMMAEELRRVGGIAGPMVGVTLMQYFLQIVSVMMVGHMGTQLSLSAATLAFSLATITGLSVHLGMAGGLETLGGQAYGAQEYQKLGILTYTAMFSQILVSFPLAIVWLFMDKILVLLRQDPDIAREAGKFARRLIPSLFAHAFFQPLVRYFQMQCLIWPLLVSIAVAFVLHIPLCWALVYKTRLASYGAAVAFDISSWLFVVFLGLFMKLSSRCAKTRAPFSLEMVGIMFSDIGPYLWFATLEYWAFEIIVLLAGLFDNPELETSVLALCVSTLTAVYTIPYGLGCGSGNAKRVNVIVYTIISVVGFEAITVSLTLFATRHVFGYIFSKDKQVVDYFATITPLICCSVVVDGFLCVLSVVHRFFVIKTRDVWLCDPSGVSRGCGLQKFVTAINAIAYYFIAIPVSGLLGFKFNLKGKGLWGGVLLGEIVQLLALSVMISCTNWNKQATQAQNRVSRGRSFVESTQDEPQTSIESQTPRTKENGDPNS